VGGTADDQDVGAVGRAGGPMIYRHDFDLAERLEPRLTGDCLVFEQQLVALGRDRRVAYGERGLVVADVKVA
jgi:hypothetical protein